MPPFRNALLVLALCLASSAVVAADLAPRSFSDYRAALQAGETLPFPPLVVSEHPGMPWLIMEWMRPQLDTLDAEAVARFVSRHRHRPFAVEFRRDWLLALGQAGRWRAFSRHYRGERDQALQCLALQARLAAGQRERVERAASALWLTARVLPDECQTVIDHALRVGAITRPMIRERFHLALANDNLALAESLAAEMGPEAIARIQHQRLIREQPETYLAGIRWSALHGEALSEAALALRRLARRDVPAAIAHWEAAEMTEPRFTARDRFLTIRRIALEAARDHLPEATEWLARTPASDEFIQTWRIRHALRTGNWPAVLDGIEAHPKNASRQWRYWRARALMQTGREAAANRLYQGLATSNDYYGLLAARRLSLAPTPTVRPISPDPDSAKRLEERPGLAVAWALFEEGWESAARAEWRHSLQELPAPDRCQAALMANERGWASEAIITAARAGCRGDHQVDYPLAFAERVTERSRELDLDPAWTWSIMRAESLFATDARSRVGALGLMQLMPATARQVAAQQGMEIQDESDILQPARNIDLGTGYLREMLDRFDGHPLVATAAYNAGPHRAQAWMPESGMLEGDVWAETIPFRETRRYIRRVMIHSLGFDRRLGRSQEQLGQRFAPVGRHAFEDCLALADPQEEAAVSC